MHMEAFSGLRNRPRSVAALCVMILIFFASAPADLRLPTRLLLAWDAGTILYLGSSLWMMLRSDLGDIRLRAQQQDEGGLVILLLTVAAVAVSLGAIAAELRSMSGGSGEESVWRLALAGITILLSWIFTQILMTAHYAREYYADPQAEGGMRFPEQKDEPDYLDFAYFAFTMGAACQTSDVSVTTRGMRRLVLAHTILAFLFNTTILALAVNVGASVL